jgi:hypothetical protein
MDGFYEPVEDAALARMREAIRTPEAFRAWVALMRDEGVQVLGQSCHGTSCPIANWLSWLVFGTWSTPQRGVIVTRLGFWRYGPGPYDDRLLRMPRGDRAGTEAFEVAAPAWMHEFTRLVDLNIAWQASPEDVLALLDEATKEVQHG